MQQAIDDTPTITAREMSEIFEQMEAGITASKMLTEHMERIDMDAPQCAYYAGAWWALQEAKRTISVALGMELAGPSKDPWDSVST